MPRPKRARITSDELPRNPTAPLIKRQRDRADTVRSVGVTLRGSTLERLELQAERLGVARNALMRYLLLHGLDALEQGELEPRTKRVTTTELDMP